jgi:hypothetical protein
MEAGEQLLPESHTCLQCGQEFADRQNLQDHVSYVHEKIKGHQCDACGMEFGFKSTLDHHFLSTCREGFICYLGPILMTSVSPEKLSENVHPRISETKFDPKT